MSQSVNVKRQRKLEKVEEYLSDTRLVPSPERERELRDRSSTHAAASWNCVEMYYDFCRSQALDLITGLRWNHSDIEEFVASLKSGDNFISEQLWPLAAMELRLSPA